jgi:phage terminase Nu1 subunit (DNA packaging protein)
MAEGNLCKVDIIAQLFGVSVRRVQQLTQDGVIHTIRDPNGGGRKYEFIPTVQEYIRYLSDKAYGKERSERESELKEQKLKAEIALKESQGELHKLKTEIAAGKYISVEEVKLDYQRFFVVLKKFVLSLPNRIVGLVGTYVDPVTSRALEKDMASEANDLLKSFVVAAQDRDADQDGEGE